MCLEKLEMLCSVNIFDMLSIKFKIHLQFSSCWMFNCGFLRLKQNYAQTVCCYFDNESNQTDTFLEQLDPFYIHILHAFFITQTIFKAITCLMHLEINWNPVFFFSSLWALFSTGLPFSVKYICIQLNFVAQFYLKDVPIKQCRYISV